MSSPFLAPVFSQPTDPNLLSKAAQDPVLPPASSPWKYAVERFNSTLTTGSSKTIPATCSGGLEEFIASVMQAQLTAQKRRSKALDKINAIIDRISYYKMPIDTLAQTSQEALFVWGSLKFLMEIVGSEKKVSDKLAEAIADVVGIFGRCEIYARLFASNKRVVEGIGTLYGDVLKLLVGATRFYSKSGVKRFLTASTTPFEVKFAPLVADVEKHANIVQQEVNAAFLEDEKEENGLQRIFREEQQSVQTDQRKKDVTLWLHPTDAASDLQKLRKDRTADTCGWLQKKEVFESWRTDTTSSILWVYGIPGSGKSILASYIVDQLKSKTDGAADPTPHLIFFFCSNWSESRRASMHILRSLIHQLTVQRPELWEIIDKAYSKSTSPKADVFEELWEMFMAMLRTTKNVLCVVDGLDECQNREEDGTLERSVFAQRLLALCDETSSNHSCKVLLTSRHEPDLASTFKEGKSVRTLSITADDVAHDIRAFISSTVSAGETLRDFPSETQESIVTTLSENASGMFIWAKLMLQLLEKAESPEAIEVTLQKLPRKLVDLYDRILKEVADRFSESDGLRDLGGFTLVWVVYSARQLTITELAEARQIVPGCQALVKKRKPFSLVSFRRLIQKACSPLVEVRDDGLLQLAHHTTKEYLLSSAAKVFDITQPLSTFQVEAKAEVDPHSILFEHCFSYLSASTFKTPLLGTKKRFTDKNQSTIRVAHPLLEYAAANWLVHAQNSQNNHYSRIRQFLASQQVASWIEAILVQAGVPHLATIGDLVPTRVASQNMTDQDAEWIREWFNKLQRVVFTWGGTLGETPSEIHHLHLTDLLPETNGPQVKLQRMTKLLDPTDWRPQSKPIQNGDTFVLRQPYVFAFDSNRKRARMDSRSVTRYHWLSMQGIGQVPLPLFVTRDGRMRVVTQVQISESGRYILVVWLSFSSLTTCVWSISDDGFDPLPWSDGGRIDHVEAGSEGVRSFPYSNSYLYKGRGFYDSHRCAAFSHDERYIHTPGGRYTLLTGTKSSVPPCCTESEVSCASWSLFGDRIACIRSGKGVEVYEHDSRLAGQLHEERLARATIKDFSKSGRYVLLKTENHLFSLYDIESNALYNFSPPHIKSPFGDFVVEGDLTDDATFTLSFSPCESYILCIIDNSSYMLPCFLLVWSLENRTLINSQAFPPLSKTSPIYAAFDHVDSTILHILVTNTNSSHGKGFIEYSLTDDWSASKNYGTSWRDWKADIGITPRGGFVHRKSWARHEYGDGDVEPLIDFFLWDLETAPPLFRGRAKIQRSFEGWTDGYSQTNGFWDNGLIASKEVSKFLVGGRVFEYPPTLECETTSVDLEGNVIIPPTASQSPFEPTLSRDFDANLAWSRLVKKGKTDPTTEKGLEDIKTDAYKCFLSPDESLACFYADKVYLSVMDLHTGELIWFHQFEGDVQDYVVRKPLFHPSRRILAWLEQLGKSGDDFHDREECGMWIVEIESVDSKPVRLDHGVHSASNYLFHPSRRELYVSCVGTKFLRVVCFSIPTSPISSDSPTSLLWHLKLRHPLPLPSYEYGDPNPDLGAHDPRMVLYNGEIYFLFNSGYKIFLAKVERDGEVKWKKVGSKPGPPRVADVYLCAGWKGDEERRGRIDVICSRQGEEERPVVINSWIEDEGWDEVVKVESENCAQCEKLGK